jgi:hypothetical protein
LKHFDNAKNIGAGAAAGLTIQWQSSAAGDAQKDIRSSHREAKW